MFDVVSRPVFDLLSVNLHGAITIFATDVCRLGTNRFRHGHLFPSPLVSILDFVFLALLAAEHQIVWHGLHSVFFDVNGQIRRGAAAYTEASRLANLEHRMQLVTLGGSLSKSITQRRDSSVRKLRADGLNHVFHFASIC
jgi:hypothetical protein